MRGRYEFGDNKGDFLVLGMKHRPKEGGFWLELIKESKTSKEGQVMGRVWVPELMMRTAIKEIGKIISKSEPVRGEKKRK